MRRSVGRRVAAHEAGRRIVAVGIEVVADIDAHGDGAQVEFAFEAARFIRSDAVGFIPALAAIDRQVVLFGQVDRRRIVDVGIDALAGRDGERRDLRRGEDEPAHHQKCQQGRGDADQALALHQPVVAVFVGGLSLEGSAVHRGLLVPIERSNIFSARDLRCWVYYTPLNKNVNRLK
jgi:hypothetical protein